jgi:hypothetical protein
MAMIITVKHPVMVGGEASVRMSLESPDEIRERRIDPDVLLFYKRKATKRWVCAAAKKAADQTFLITAYPTDAIKEGARIWPK